MKWPTFDEIEAMSFAELEAFLSDGICQEPGCYRERAPGYMICLNCLHGTSCRAAEEYVVAKKRFERMQKKLAKCDPEEEL